MKKVLVFICLILFPVSVFAAKDTEKKKVEDSISLECDKVDKINVNEQIICRVTTNAAFYYNRISFDILNMEGIQIVDVRSNYGNRWKIEKDDKGRITAVSDSIQSDLQEFGILLIKAVKDGREDLTLDNVVLENTLDEEIKTLNLNPVNQTLKIVSSDNTLKSIMIDGKEITGFNKNTTKYNIIIGDKSEIKIEAESNNEFATIDGIGDIKLNAKANNFVVPITVVSEDGASKVYVLFLNRNEKNLVKGLESLNIKNDRNNTLLVSFNPEVAEYNVEVDGNTKSLDIKPTLSEGFKFVKGYGEQKVNLLSGNNLILIKVEDNDGNQYTYILNVVKPIAGKSSNNFIKTLLIKDYKLDFSKRVKNYTLYIKDDVSSLEITPILESDTSRYTISGNKDLKEGSVIRIEVTAENEEKVVYKLNIKIKHESYRNYIFIILGGLLVMGLGVKFKDKLVSLFKIEGKDKIKEEAVNVLKDTIKDVVKEVIPVEEKKETKTAATVKNTASNKSTTKKNTNKKSTTNKSNTTKKNTNNKPKSANTTTKKTTTTKKKSTTKKKKTNTNSSKNKTTTAKKKNGSKK